MSRQNKSASASGTAIRIEKQADGRYLLSGELSARSVVRVLNLLPIHAEGKGGEIHVDLAGVSRSDSSGLALLIEWIRLAGRHGSRIRFHNLPGQMMEIAKISDLLPILPLE